MAKHLCPICGKYEFEEENSYDICEVCGWEDDLYINEDGEYDTGANHVSYEEAKEAWANGKTVWQCEEELLQE